MPLAIPPMSQPRILVTGGGGFLGRHVLAVLSERAYQHVYAPRRAEYDLTRANEVAACIRDVEPVAIIHLAAIVGGIGANLERPGDFLYQNLIMGTQLMEYARLADVQKFVAVAPSAHIRNSRRYPSMKRICGLATQRRRTPRAG